MIYLKNLCLLLIFACIFINSSAAQGRTQPEPPPEITESSDKVNPRTLRFESKAGNFSINLFQAPFKTRTIEASKGTEPGKHFFWQFEGIVYTVMYSAFNKNELTQAFNEMNSGARKGVVNAGGKVISEKPIIFGKYPAREFRGLLSNGLKYIGRNYLVNDMGYLLTASYADEKSEKEALEILDSFKLLTEKK